MRHKLLYLLALALTATSSGWGQDASGVPAPFSTQSIEKTDLKTKTGLFANGHAITIEVGSSEGKIKVSTTDMDTNVSYETDGASTVVFGGKYNESCESSSVTMKSGTVYSIVGGGYGAASNSVTKVTTANIYLEGGTVSNFIVGGGALWSEVTTANIQTQGDGTFTHNGWMIPAMESGSSGNTNGKYPEYDKAACKVGDFNVTLNKGTYWLIALAGGNGHFAYTKNGIAKIKGTAENPVVIRGGLFGCGSNGRGDTADAEVEYCTMSGKDLELASVNRGKLKSVKFAFKNCTFSDEIYAYLGSTYKWGDQYASSEVGIPESVEFTFDPSCTGVPAVGISEGLELANVTLTGATAKIASFARDNNTNITSFTIGTDKTWTFNHGLEIDNNVTLTKNGTLKSAMTAEKQSDKSYIVYANGTPIEITASSTDHVQITKQGETAVAFKVPSTSKIYGGAKESTVASTSINMISGTVRTMLGGGNSTKSDTPADVTGKISIQIQKDATVSYLLVGGGYRYSKANEVYIEIQGGTVSQLYPGGDDGGKTTNTIDTPLDQSVNGVKTVTINMNGGVIAGGIGCGGGNGYTHTGVSTVTIQNATIAAFYGTLSNGRADEITATVTGCTFPTSINGTAIKDREFATINRGAVGTASFKFDGCTFEEPGNMNASLGAIMGWADSDTNGRPEPAVDGTVSFEFINSKSATPLMVFSRGLHQANINLSGAKASLVSFRDGTAVEGTLSEFALGEGKTWNLDGGLSVAEGVTFTKQGTLNATALDASDLLALASVHADKIALVEGTYELPSQLTITKPMVLNGARMDKTVIKAGTADWAHTYNADLNMISIENATDITPVEGGEVVISNLTASNAKRNGLNVQTSMAVKLDSVTLKDNTAAGLVVHSKVDATDIHTSGNAWGGVNIDKGTPEYSTLCFTFDANSTFAEKAPIYTELYDQEGIVVVPDDSWERLVQMSAESKGVAMWLKRLIVTAGQTLTADATYANRNVYIENTGTLNVTAPLAFAKVTMEEGARLVPTSPATTTDKITATTLQLNTPLKDSEWKAFGFPSTYKVQSTTEPATEYTQPTADPKANTGAWYATLKGTSSPEFEYKTDEFGQAGLLSATTGEYAIVSTAADPIELKAATEPDAPTTATFTIFANTGTDELTLTKNQYVYKLNAASNEFVQCTEKTLKPFESVIFTDVSTYSTLRSLRLGDNIVTGTQEIEPVEGYYVTTDRGAIMIHTAEPVQVLIVEMSGRIAYKGIATDGQRIMVPAGIYAVNGQLVRVK